MHSQYDHVSDTLDVEAHDSAVPSVGSERRRKFFIFAVCLAVAALVGLTDAGFKARSTMTRTGKFDGLVGLSSADDDDNDVIWEQVSGAVEIDQIKEKLAQPNLDEETKAKLQEQLDSLTESIPDYEDIKEKYADMWDDVEDAVKLEELQQKVDNAKKMGSENLEELQGQLDAAMEKVDTDAIKKQASDQWQELKDQLPDIEELRGKSDELKSQLSDATDSLQDSAQDFIGSWR